MKTQTKIIIGILSGIAVVGIGVLIWGFSTGQFKFFAAGEQLTLSSDKANYDIDDSITVDISVDAPSSPTNLTAVITSLDWVASKADIELTDVRGLGDYNEGTFNTTTANQTGTITFNVLKGSGSIPAGTPTSVAKLTFRAVSARPSVTISVITATVKNTDTQEKVDLLPVKGVTFSIGGGAGETSIVTPIVPTETATEGITPAGPTNTPTEIETTVPGEATSTPTTTQTAGAVYLQADIWGPDKAPDGKVNTYDLSRMRALQKLCGADPTCPK